MDMCIPIKLVFDLLEYLKNYKKNGYELTKIKLNELTDLVGTKLVFNKCQLRKKNINDLIMKPTKKLSEIKKNILK